MRRRTADTCASDGPGTPPRKRRAAAGIYSSKRAHIRYHADGRIASAPFFTPAACRAVIELCNAHAVTHGGWSTELAVQYPQTTTDLEVDRMPSLRAWLTDNGFVEAVRSHYRGAHAAPLFALDDLFVIKHCYASTVAKLGNRN